MKSVLLAAAIAAAIVSPALAKSPARHSHHVVNAQAAIAPDRFGVYVDGREVARDPDPSIRSSLRDEYLATH